MIRGGRRPRRPKRSLSVKGNPVSYILRIQKKKYIKSKPMVKNGNQKLEILRR